MKYSVKINSKVIASFVGRRDALDFTTEKARLSFPKDVIECEFEGKLIRRLNGQLNSSQVIFDRL